MNETTAAPFLVGAAKRDITILLPGHGMMGWSDPGHVAGWVEAPIHARAYVVQSARTGRKVVLVNVEICFITVALNEAVVQTLQREHPELGYSSQNVHLSAQHTHSAPGGYSHFLIYSMTCPGFTPQVFETYRNGIVEAIVAADAAKQPGSLRRAQGAFAEDIPVAFSRAIKPYNLNPEVEPLPLTHTHLALDRNMYLLRMDDANGNPIGSINWFGLHTTTVHKDQTCISPDNKGFAARKMEQGLRNQAGAPDVISAFAQNTAGDVSPNYKMHAGIEYQRGKYRDDFANLKEIGTYQAEHARGLWDKAAQTEAMPDEVDYLQLWVDMSNQAVSEEFTHGVLNQRTGEAIMGIYFMGGTLEGPGIPLWLAGVLSAFAKSQGKQDADIHGEKAYAVRAIEQTFVGFKAKDIPIPAWASGFIAILKDLAKRNAFGTKPILPNVLPVQIVILGDLALASIPAEPTTIAGRRIANTVQEVLAKRGIKQVICAGYTGGYSGYVTTREEYGFQRYEGGHTLFGKWTCAAYQTILKRMAEELLKEPEQRTLTSEVSPLVFTQEELEVRSYKGPNPAFFLDDLRFFH
jgi:neutral ceramidase